MRGRSLLQLVVGLFPASGVKNAALRRLGHAVGADCRIASILLLGDTRMVVGDGASIGPLTIFRHVRADIGARAEIGQLNWISAAPFLVDGSPVPEAGSFVLGADASLTNRHYVDVSGGVSIGRFTTVAGVRSVFMTHGIHPTDGVLDTAPIRVGDYAMIGSSVNLVLGATVPDHSVVSMGSTVVRGLDRTHALYAGVPARFKKDVPLGYYGTRDVGPIAPRWAPWQ